ncbi:MAG: hypothetical protein LCI00_24430 [Chloroflexi bacterium]|nr:hypothetical protein [Chloroflexota bacterium]
MPTNNFNDVIITGNQDTTQLQVKANATQTKPLQSWKDSGPDTNPPLSQVTGDGRLQVGDDVGLASPDALIESHRNDTSTTKPKRGFHSLGRVAGTLNSVVQWIVTELELRGSGVISAVHSALRVKVTNLNTATPSAGAELRGGDIEVVNDASASASALPKATGLHVAVTNASGKIITDAVGLKVKLNNSGTITNPYSIYTEGPGAIHLEDFLEVKTQASSPSTPVSNFVKLYPKSDGKLYIKDWNGVETPVGGAAVIPETCNGRLTLTSNTPVTSGDVTAATTLYFTPFRGNQVALYNGSSWVQTNFSERILSLSGLAANTNHDIFLYNNAGTLTLEALAWTNNTTRVSLGLQDNIYVKGGAVTRRYLGTIRTTSTAGQTEDSQARRFVWNCYHRVNKPLIRRETQASWNYNTATARAAFGNNANRVEIVTGLAEKALNLSLHVSYLCSHTSSIGYSVWIGEDSTTTPASELVGGRIVAPGDGGGIATAQVTKIPSIGYHYYQWIEIGAGVGAQSWFAGSGVNSGLVGEIEV